MEKLQTDKAMLPVEGQEVGAVVHHLNLQTCTLVSSRVVESALQKGFSNAPTYMHDAIHERTIFVSVPMH